MTARKNGLTWVVTSAYAVIASIWIIVPDVLVDTDRAIGGVVGGLAWDGLFTFVSAALLYLALRQLPEESLSKLAPPGRLPRWLAARPRHQPAALALGYALLTLLMMTMPDWLQSGMASRQWQVRLTLCWDALYVAATAILLFHGLRRLRRPGDEVAGRRHGSDYLFAIVSSLLVIGMRAQLHPEFGKHHRMLLFLIPISLSALLGGVGPGLLSTGLITSVIGYLFFTSTPDMAGSPMSFLLSLSLLALNGVLLSLVSEIHLQGKAKLEAALRRQSADAEALRQSDERFRALFEGSPVAMAISRLADGLLEEVNEAFLDMFGLEEQAVLGRTTGELGIWQDVADRQAIVSALREQGCVQGAPVALRRSDGSVLYALLSFRQVRFGGGEHIHGVVLDVSAQHAAQQALLRIEHEFRLLIDSITDYAFFLLSPEGLVLNWSNGSQGIKGYTTEEIVGRSFDCFYTAEDQAAGVPQQLLANAAQQGRDVHEGWRVRRDGSRFWARAILYAIRGDDGELQGYAKVTQDLTLQQAAERELRDSEARYAGMIRSAMDGVISIDAGQRITLFNPAAERMFGYSVDAMLGQPLDRLLPPMLSELHRGKVEAFGRGMASSRRMGGQGKIQGMRAGGELFDLEASISRLEVAGERSYTVILRDVSERENTLAELRRHLQQLESMNELARAILAAGMPEQVAQLGLRYLRRLLPFWGATAMIVDWEAGATRVLAVEREPGASYDPGQRLTLISYGLEDLERLKKGLVCRVDDLDALPRRSSTLERLRLQGMQSYIRIPLMAAGELLGMMNLASDKLGAFSEAQQEVADVFAQQLAIALQQSLLRQSVERLGRVYRLLSRVNTLIVRCHQRRELFDGVCRIAVEDGAYRMAWIGVMDPQSGDGEVAAFCGEDDSYRALIRLSARADSPFADRPACRAVREQEMVVCNDVQADPSLRALARDLMARGLRAVACLPIVTDGRAQAVLALFSEASGAFDRQEVQLLRELSGDIAFALSHIGQTERLDYLAYYDSLTGLANRGLLAERLAQRITDAAERRFAIAFLDLEHFKSINDVFGRVIGDQVLQRFADRLLRHVQDASQLSRIGADQFALILPQAGGEEEAARQVQKLQLECLDAQMEIGGAELRLSAKFGIAMYPDDGAQASDLMEHVESALKRAKAAGAKSLFYRQEMTERAAAALELGNLLHAALARGQFELHYQPKVEANSHHLVGVEALLRWRHPERGLVSPEQFVPLLEELGLIVEAGRWALEQAARDHRGWREAGLASPRVAVNVSPRQLGQADFVAMLAEVLAPYGADHGIDLEITESQIMEDVDGGIAKLREARELGVAIAVDDFGTGYSSLAYLARLPVQALKIDRSFVMGMLDEPESMTLVETIISLAHAMQLEVVAEGVENAEQARVLAGLNCDVLQGYWLSRPLSADQLADKLRQERRWASPLKRG
ncbi:EAL domain-containing protein [Chromobacterium subtsugae]|uniref:EAL domain-containing protein n=1 Tax=Chromobacterium subtsugae TaxID=251747 RepID=UPI0007F92EE3|nr:EAL domain-containing protein [Chromobacterium subtsugae]